MNRIAVIGSPGAGKSTLARRLGDALGMEVIHLDRLFWLPGWVQRPRPEWIALQQELVQRDRWIIDGNYGGTMEVRLARADAVIYLDYPPLICLWGAVKRRVQYSGRARPDLDPGCEERLDWEFLRYIWEFPRKSRPHVEAKLAALPPDVPVYRLRSRREAEAFLREIPATFGPFKAARGENSI